MRRAAYRAAAAFLLAALLPSPARAGAPDGRVKIYTEEPGVHRVRFEELSGGGLGPGPVPSASLGLSSSGRPVPIHVHDGSDGSFGPGDWLEFVAERLPGEFSQANEYTPLNVYLLDRAAADPARFSGPAAASPPPASDSPVGSPFRVARRDEKDLLLLRFSDRKRSDLWFWQKLTYLDAEPFRYALELPGLDGNSSEPVEIRVSLRGLSQPARRAPEVREHRVEVSLNGKVVAAAEWDGVAEAHRVAVPGLTPASFVPGENLLEVRVPARPQAGGDPLVDVSALNWIEVDYPRTARIREDRQERVLRSGTDGRTDETLETAGGRPVVVYGERSGRRIVGSTPERAADAFRQRFPGLFAEEAFWTVPEGAALSPVAIEPFRVAGLASGSRQADYVMIVHPRLREAIEPLAEFHRRRGLSVAIVDVREVYDEFNHGILSPWAIREFLTTAVRSWRRAPRFVLLVGDASWDSRNRQLDDVVYPDTVYRSAFKERFFLIAATPYPEKAEVNHRNLVPTWSYETYDGHAAGDAWFGTLGEPDGFPRLAIGRLPVTEPEEVAAIVAKTIAYAEKPQVGPWRRRIVWITNGTDGMRRFSDILSKELAPRGLGALKVFPDAKEKDNAVHQERIREAFGDGQLFVHFNGHGGRFIWLTSLQRFDRAANDLFTLEDLDLLAPTSRLPIVLSMTCYSAPFDHPSADSIGEKLLRLPGKGAVAVVAASWRNAPTLAMSQALLGELSKGGTAGEALMHAKRRAGDPSFLEQYNLLGDPALPVARPALDLAVEPEGGSSAAPSFRARVPAPRFRGRALVEWFDERGDVVESIEQAVDGTAFPVALRDATAAARVRGVSVYAWDEEAGVDAMGGAEVPASPAKGQDAPRPER